MGYTEGNGIKVIVINSNLKEKIHLELGYSVFYIPTYFLEAFNTEIIC